LNAALNINKAEKRRIETLAELATAFRQFCCKSAKCGGGRVGKLGAIIKYIFSSHGKIRVYPLQVMVQWGS